MDPENLRMSLVPEPQRTPARKLTAHPVGWEAAAFEVDSDHCAGRFDRAHGWTRSLCLRLGQRVGIELRRAGCRWRGYQARSFDCELGSQFHHGRVSGGPQ